MLPNNGVIAVIIFASITFFSSPLQGEDRVHPRVPARMNTPVATCTNIQLTATYLAESAAGGAGFQFAIHNGTDHAVAIMLPAPTSAHWYAREGSHWSWRASNGAGGSPVDAMNPQGRMFAFRVASGDRSGNVGAGQDDGPGVRRLTVGAHGFQSWVLKASENPVLKFKPSCTRCNHPADREFRVVFAYAVLPGAEEAGADEARILRCGLRSSPVAVPASYSNPAGSAGGKLSMARGPEALPRASLLTAHSSSEAQ